MERKNFSKYELKKKALELKSIYGMDESILSMSMYVAGYNGDITLDELNELRELKKEGILI